MSDLDDLATDNYALVLAVLQDNPHAGLMLDDTDQNWALYGREDQEPVPDSILVSDEIMTGLALAGFIHKPVEQSCWIVTFTGLWWLREQPKEGIERAAKAERLTRLKRVVEAKALAAGRGEAKTEPRQPSQGEFRPSNDWPSVESRDYSRLKLDVEVPSYRSGEEHDSAAKRLAASRTLSAIVGWFYETGDLALVDLMIEAAKIAQAQTGEELTLSWKAKKGA